LAPLSSDDDYISFLIDLIEKIGIDIFFPTVDSEIKKIAKEKHHIEMKTGCIVFVEDLEKVAITDDKLETIYYLQEHNFQYPESLSADDPSALAFVKNHGYPLVIKRRVGCGAQDVHVVKSLNEAMRFVGNPHFMLQEWLDPAQGEYTSGFYIGDDLEVKGACTFLRKLKGGSTVLAERIIDEKLEDSLEKIAVSLGMKYLNIQTMRRDNVLIPFELNGRLSGTTSIVSKIFNAPEMFILEKIFKQTLQRVRNNERFIAMRYYDEIYASLDDVEKLITRSNVF
jgi:carbamoylphosphate synthase large subunit